MKRPTNQKIDEMIAQTMRVEDRNEFEVLGELTLFEQIVETFRGRTRWLNGILIVHTLIFTTLFGISISRFLAAIEVRDQIMWASLGIISMIVIGQLKMWYWMELNRVNMIREIKRLELQVARLANPKI